MVVGFFKSFLCVGIAAMVVYRIAYAVSRGSKGKVNLVAVKIFAVTAAVAAPCNRAVVLTVKGVFTGMVGVVSLKLKAC